MPVPTIAGGSVTTYRGDAYKNDDHRALEWENSDFPTLTGSTIAVIIEGVATFAGTAPAADKARLELTNTQSLSIPAGRHHFQVVATQADSDAITLVDSTWISRDRVEV